MSNMLASQLCFACSARHPKRHQTRQATPTRLFIWSDPVPQQFSAHVTHMQHTYNIIQRTFNIFNSHHGSNGSRRFASSALRCTGYGTDQQVETGILGCQSQDVLVKIMH